MDKKVVAVWGARGNAGKELVGILEQHPHVEEIIRVGREFPEDCSSIEAAFLALPQGESGRIASRVAKAGRKVIDLSGDLRFPDPAQYEKWYRQEHPAPDLLPVPYALPELYRESLGSADMVSMPGCYPTATLLGVIPVIRAGLLAHSSRIHVVAQSGLSGRGNRPVDEVHYGNVVPYNPGHVHRHVGEIEQFTSGHAINFVPSTVDTYRGMLVTASVDAMTAGVRTDHVHQVLEEAYADEPFVHVLPIGEIPTLKTASTTDACYLGATAANGCITIMSAIDNLRKGAASQAVQVFNLLYEYDETSGLRSAPPPQDTNSTLILR